MARKGPEDRMVDRAIKEAKAKYGPRLVVVRYPKGPYMVAGISDLLVCLDGRFGAAEAKAPDEDTYSGTNTHGVTLKQEAFILRVERAGGVAGVFRSVPEFMSFLETLAHTGGA